MKPSIFIVAVLCITPLLADPATYSDLRAELSHKRYVIACDKAQKDFEKQVEALKKQHLLELKKAMDECTKAGLLDDAVQIRDAMQKLEKEKPEKAPDTPKQPAPPLLRLLDGKYKFHWEPLGGANKKVQIHYFVVKNGKCNIAEVNTDIKLTDGCFVITAGGYTWVLSPTPGAQRFLIERWTGESVQGASEAIGICEKIN